MKSTIKKGLIILLLLVNACVTASPTTLHCDCRAINQENLGQIACYSSRNASLCRELISKIDLAEGHTPFKRKTWTFIATLPDATIEAAYQIQKRMLSVTQGTSEEVEDSTLRRWALDSAASQFENEISKITGVSKVERITHGPVTPSFLITICGSETTEPSLKDLRFFLLANQHAWSETASNIANLESKH